MAYTTINKSTDYFNTKLYTGNGSAGHSITGVGFQPDWVWIKQRDIAENNETYDAVRGVTKAIFTDSTSVEVTQSAGLASFNSDGFTVGNRDNVNKNSGTYASWNWKANGQGSSNTDGSINTTYTSVNTTAGFSISTYTGTGSAATVGHGLGVLPSMIIIKSRSKSGQNWITWHKAFTGNNEYVELNTTDAKDTYDMIDNTSNTTSVFAISGDGNVNESGATYVAYCFAEKQGYSKFGSYTGNGSNDGVFVYTGFRPEFLIVKRTDSSAGWSMVDSKRDTYNSAIKRLIPSGTNAENTSLDPFVDLLSNGFNMQAGSTAFNGSGGNYIYIAFGQSLVGTNNVPCTAR